MHNLNTAFSTTWFLAPYCAWLGYGEYLEWFGGVARLADAVATYLNGGYVWLNR